MKPPRWPGIFLAAWMALGPARADEGEAAEIASILAKAPTPRATLTAPQPALAHDPGRTVTPGAFQPNWTSLEAGYTFPDWFRDAKFGIWAHWTAQSQPEEGDWYARGMYLQGTKQNIYHVAHYGPPSKFGFKDMDHLWRAENWDPDQLMQLYVAAGAHYFMALANHHDNFDCYDSKWQPGNSVNIGPHKDIVGLWAAAARKYGLRFAVSNHSSHAWHWLQPAYGYDAEGPLAGVPYDGWLTKADGKGTWWEGYDPQDLYAGPRMVIPSGMAQAADEKKWHQQNDAAWFEKVPPQDNGYTDKWFLRAQDLVQKYHPDMVYFDDGGLPLGQAGLDFAADYYNANAQWHNGENQAVVTAKGLSAAQSRGIVDDYEIKVSDQLRPEPWETDTCIGQWHYKRDIPYKSVEGVVRMLCDIVSKNGNLMLNIPLKGDGTIDDRERVFLQGMAAWMKVNGEGIFGTRPWKIYGEGPHQMEVPKGQKPAPYAAADIRFTTKGPNTLYAFFLGWPADGKLTIHALDSSADHPSLLGTPIRNITLLGAPAKLVWTQDDAGLHVTLTGAPPSVGAGALKLELQ